MDSHLFSHIYVSEYFPNYARRLSPRICAVHLLRMAKFIEGMFNIQIENLQKLATEKVHLSMYLANVLAKRMETSSVRMTGEWENVLWYVVDLAKHWSTGQILDFGILKCTCVKSWILRMFTDPILCPNKYLRMEMLRFIGMWPETYLQDATIGTQAAAGLVSASACMQLDHLTGGYSQMKLFYSLTKVLYNLHKYGYLVAVTAAAVDQVKNLKIGPEVIFFKSIIRLLAQKAKATVEMNRASSLDLSSSALIFNCICDIFLLLVVRPPTMMAFQCPGLAQVAASALVTITSSVVAVRSTPQIVDSATYFSFTAGLSKIFKNISLQKQFRLIWRVLKADHAQLLSSLNSSGFSFQYFPNPCEESTEECPEKFMDSITLAVMEAPMLLHSSKMVVDESTLIHLLLESPSDPFTRCPLDDGSYSSLPHLKADILAWRNNVGRNLDSEDFGSVEVNTESGEENPNGCSSSCDTTGDSDTSSHRTGGRIFNEWKGDSSKEDKFCEMCKFP